jgi:hypothetical protein
MKKELDQIVTFGPGVKAFRIVVDADDVAEEKAGSQPVRTENAKRLGDQLRAGLANSRTNGD